MYSVYVRAGLEPQAFKHEPQLREFGKLEGSKERENSSLDPFVSEFSLPQVRADIKLLTAIKTQKKESMWFFERPAQCFISFVLSVLTESSSK